MAPNLTPNQRATFALAFIWCRSLNPSRHGDVAQKCGRELSAYAMSLMVSWSIVQRKAVVSAEEASHIKGGVFQGRNLQNWALMFFFVFFLWKKYCNVIEWNTYTCIWSHPSLIPRLCARETAWYQLPDNPQRKTRNSIVGNTHLQYNFLHHQKIDVLWGLLVEITKISTSPLLLSNCFVAASFSAIYVY